MKISQLTAPVPQGRTSSATGGLLVKREFFVVALPGLEDLVEAEIRDWYPGTPTEIQHGGVMVHTELASGLEMNLCLRTATRILVRVARFRCRDFPRLFKTVSGVNWREWVRPEVRLHVHASTRGSRLKIKRRIEETCLEAWRSYQKCEGLKADSVSGSVDLYVRIFDDVCTLSLDTSGERLHKRGEKPLVGEAPLRESIAAALIQWVGREYGRDGAEVIDPMMGSGTFLLEAGRRDSLIETRDFAASYGFVQKLEGKPRLRASRPTLVKLIGFERDAKTFSLATENLRGIQAEFHQQDFLTAKPLPSGSRPRWLFANPPYGERLKLSEPLPAYYEKLFAACERVARPELACVILPTAAVKGKWTLPSAWKVLKKRPFLNGGIPVTAFLFGRRSV
jgi:putative N6-adenine-specific DNA methylase